MVVPFYTRGDQPVVENIIEEFEAERDRLDAAFTAVGAALGAVPTEKVEHDVDFNDHTVPSPTEFRTRVALSAMTALGGFVTVGFGAPPVAPIATFDILVGGVSILTAPVPGAALAPGVPVPIPFVAVPVAPPGLKIEYVWSDGGAPSFMVSANVRWGI